LDPQRIAAARVPFEIGVRLADEAAIRGNAVAPGAIATPMNKRLARDPGAEERIARRIPMRRMGTPEEMAATFSFLASDDASYITGQTHYACGGLTLFGDFMDDRSS